MSVLVEKSNSSIDSPVFNTRQGHYLAANNKQSLSTTLTLVFISILTLNIILLQYIFQSFDNNRLLSWQWVMNRENILLIFSIIIAGTIIVYEICKLHISTTWALLMLLAGSYLIGVVSWSSPEVMIDSARYLNYAKYIESHGFVYFLSEWGYAVNAWTDLPLTPLIYGALFSIFGESRGAIQIINTLFFSASIYVTYLIGKELWNKKTGMYAAILLLAIPFLHIQPSQLMVDVSAMFFVSAALLTTIVALKRHSTYWAILACLTIVCALITKYSAWLVLCSLLTIPAVLSSHRMTEHIKQKIDKQLIIIVTFTSSLLSIIYYLYHPVIFNQINILMDYQLPALQRWQESYISTFFYQIHPFITLASITSIFIAIKRKDVRFLVPGVAVLIMLIMEINRARYLVILFPMLALSAAYAICQINNQLISKFITGNAVMAALIITLCANINFLHSISTVNLKNTGIYLNTLSEHDVAVILLPQTQTTINPKIALPMLDYFTDKKVYTLYQTPETITGHASGVKNSPTRFTWEINYPYTKTNLNELQNNTVIVLIASEINQKIPNKVKTLLSDYEIDRTFEISDKVFRFQTVISLYRYKGQSLSTG